MVTSPPHIQCQKGKQLAAELKISNMDNMDNMDNIMDQQFRLSAALSPNVAKNGKAS